MDKVNNPKRYAKRGKLAYHRITATMPEQFCNEVKAYADAHGITISTLIENALRKVVK